MKNKIMIFSDTEKKRDLPKKQLESVWLCYFRRFYLNDKARVISLP
jgi:hypothetical protein